MAGAWSLSAILSGLLSSLAALAASGLLGSPTVRAATGGGDVEVVRYLPAAGAGAGRGQQAALRFGLVRRFELNLQVNNAFAVQNRRAVARAEALIAAIPGVRQVIGPSGLLTINVDAAGRITSAPLLAGGLGDVASEAVRQRLIRRSDAIGWFISREGTEIRLLIDTDDLSAVHRAIESTAASSGLVLLSGVAPASPLWPEPNRAPHPFPPWLPFVLLAVAMLPAILAVALVCRPTVPRTALATIAAGLAAAAPAALAPAAGIRQMAWGAALAAATFLLLAVALVSVSGGVGRIGRRAQTTRFRVPLAILLPALSLVVAAGVLAPSLGLGTQLWRKTGVFFIEVRGDMDQPVVLREVRRMTDFLRGEAGVAHAWSIADLFFAVPAAGEDFGGIPPSSELVRAILTRARDDAAGRLELAPDHRAALVGVRLDEESGVDRLTVLEHLEDYFQHEHRPAVRRINVSDPRVSPSLRGVGKGILAADTLERVLRICARSGRILSDSDIETIERCARRATLVPAVEPARLKSEIFQAVTVFLEQVAVAEAHVGLPRAEDRQRLIDVLAGQPVDATVTDVSGALARAWGMRNSEARLGAHAIQLHRRLADVRRRHTARINFNDVLYGADLPTEGVLSEEVRDATLDAMGPIAAVPTAPNVPGAFTIDALAIGGAPSDRELSLAWLPGLFWGLLMTAAVTALLLALVGGIAGLAWLPAALAPAAPLIIFPAVAALPIGVLYLAVVAGALAGGAALAVAFAPGRRDQ